MRAWLTTELPPNIIRFHPLSGADFLGSARGSAAPVAGRGVPERQCTITREGDVFRLRDARPAQRGTLVNHRYVRSAILVPGDQVRIGATTFRFDQMPAQAGGAAGAVHGDAVP